MFIDRLNALMKESDLSFYKLSQATGINQATFTRLKSGNHKPSFEVLEKIASFFKVSKEWLETGEGEKQRPNDQIASGNGKMIRYWVDVDATAGGVQQFDDLKTNNYIDISIPEFRDCTDAVNLYGDSMTPLYKSGQIIILKEWKESFIDFGNVYLIVTKNGNRMVKYIRKGNDVDHVLCVSENSEYDPFEIEKKDIIRLYVVKGSIAKNAM